MANKYKLKKILSEICEDSSCHYNGEYCILKELIEAMGTDQRILIQLKCVEKFKYEQSEIEKKDIGWQKAWMLWAEKYASDFAKHYDPELTFKEIYKKIIK